MNRRSFLAFLGLAPAVAMVPASASGGVIQAPTKFMEIYGNGYLFGGNGPEMVWPLSRASKLSNVRKGVVDLETIGIRVNVSQSFKDELKVLSDQAKEIDRIRSAEVASAA
jgi:hypothetical protein